MCIRISQQDFLREKSRQKMDKVDGVTCESINGKGVISLNRPASLNACTIDMTRRMTQALREWEASQNFVLIKGSGKYFCAGGDVKELLTPKGHSHFRVGYAMDYLIHTLKIPYVALMDGITFGGGVALSIYGRYRIATERTLVAMPEVQIGFFPDVGSSYFLPRVLGGKKCFGMFMALTGRRLEGPDVWYTGIATHMCHSSMMGALERDLISLDPTRSSRADIEKVLQKYHDLCPDLTSKPFSFEKYLETIERGFGGASVEEIVAQMEKEAKSCTWSANVLKDLMTASPTSLKLTYRLQKMGEGRDLIDCLRTECQVSEVICHTMDFMEGITARLIDKNRKPKWTPPTLDQVTESTIDNLLKPSPHPNEVPFVSKL